MTSLWALAALLAVSVARGQSTSGNPATKADTVQTASRAALVLDPAHGGDDTGAVLTPNVSEKSVTLTLAEHIRIAAQSVHLETRTTRDSDTAVSNTQRIAVASGAGACLSIHATASGIGIHLVTELAPVPDLSAPPLVPWSDVQTTQLAYSRGLAETLRDALRAAGLSVTLEQAAVAPMSGFACPAVALEVAPLRGGDAASAADPAYLDRIAQAVAKGAAQWHAAPHRGGGAL